jgi:hypothetical protein
MSIPQSHTIEPPEEASLPDVEPAPPVDPGPPTSSPELLPQERAAKENKIPHSEALMIHKHTRCDLGREGAG